MAREVPYSKQTLKTSNPIARYAHQRRHGTAIKLSSDALNHNGVLLDFGCGRGDFLNDFSLARTDAELFGFDPYSTQVSPRYVVLNEIDRDLFGKVDVMTCFETLEHLTDEELEEFIVLAQELLGPQSKLVVSVPIIGGPPLLLKEMNRLILFRQRSDYSASELVGASLFARPAPRAANVKISHKGFDFRSLRNQLNERFKLTGEVLAPFQSLPWYANSQVFLTYQKAAD